MGCNDDLMMKYLDGCLTAAEQKKLEAHVATCAECKREFELYASMKLDFEAMAIETAPDGFENRVMAAIDKLPQPQRYTDMAIYVICAIVSVLFGGVFVVFMNSGAILDFLSTVPSMAAYVDFVRPFSAVAQGYVTNFLSLVTVVSQTLAQFVMDYRFLSLGICAVAGVVLYLFRNRLFANDETKHAED